MTKPIEKEKCGSCGGDGFRRTYFIYKQPENKTCNACVGTGYKQSASPNDEVK